MINSLIAYSVLCVSVGFLCGFIPLMILYLKRVKRIKRNGIYYDIYPVKTNTGIVRCWIEEIK